LAETLDRRKLIFHKWNEQWGMRKRPSLFLEAGK